jgi:hypothetical protein
MMYLMVVLRFLAACCWDLVVAAGLQGGPEGSGVARSVDPHSAQLSGPCL